MGRSKKEVSAMVSAAGMQASIWLKLDAAVRKAGGTDMDIYRLSTSEGDDTITEMAKVAVAAQKKDAIAVVEPPAPAIDVMKFFVPLTDNEATTLLATVYGNDEAKRVVSECRRLATDEGYNGFIFWRVAAGFMWRRHGPLLGTCRENWKYLQSWRLTNDPITVDSLAFFVPRLLSGSTGKSVSDQRTLLAETRTKYSLPEPFLQDFGSASYVAGLTLSHHRVTGERTPLDFLWARSETVHEDGNRLYFGYLFFRSHGLNCRYWRAAYPNVNVGIFPLGVVVLGH